MEYGSSSLARDGQRCIPLRGSVREHTSATASRGWESSDHSGTDCAFSSRIPGLVPRLLAETGGKHMPVRVFTGGGLQGQPYPAHIPAEYLIFWPGWLWAIQPRGS